MRLYLEVARRAFARHLTYRAATLAGMSTNIFFGLMRSLFFVSLHADDLGGMSRGVIEFLADVIAGRIVQES